MAAVVVVGTRQAPEPAMPAMDVAGFCAALQVIAATTLYDRVSPPDATPELEAFVKTLNHELALLRRQIKESCDE